MSQVNEKDYNELEKNYKELQGEYARALIAVDQLRVAKYLAHGKKHSEKNIGTSTETQTTSEVPQTPKKKLENAVSELETQIDECIPLFAANSNPVGDLDKLLQGMKSELAECLRTNDDKNTELQQRIEDCEEKIKCMEGALSVKVLDSNSRCNSRTGHNSSNSFPHTASIISGFEMSDNSGKSDFEMMEEKCRLDQDLSDIVEFHHEIRESSAVTENGDRKSPWQPLQEADNRSYSNGSDRLQKPGNHGNSDSALGSSVTVQKKEITKTVPMSGGSIKGSSRKSSAVGSLRGSVQSTGSAHSKLSLASSSNMMYCTPLDRDDHSVSYVDSECGNEVHDILRSSSEADAGAYENMTGLNKYNETLTSTPKPPQGPPSESSSGRRQHLRAKRSRPMKKETDKLKGYDSGYNEEVSRKSSPCRQRHRSPQLSPRSSLPYRDYKAEIMEVRDGVQELADRLRDLRTSFNENSRSSSPLIPPRSHITDAREALRERLRRLQCSSPASFEPGTNPSPRHEQSQRRQQSPGRQQSPRRQQSPGRRYTRSPARSVSPGYRHMSPNRHASRSPLLSRYSHSPRSRSPEYRDSRHLFYDNQYDVANGSSAPIEVGVRIGGPNTSNYDISRSQSPRPFHPVESIHVSPTSGMETHFHFNFFGTNSPTPDYSNR